MTDQKRMKIIYLIGELSMGGSERQLYLLLSHIDLIRVEPIVVALNPSLNKGYQKALVEAGIQVVQLPENKKHVFQRLIYFANLFRKEKPDIVHSWSVHDNPYAGIAGLLTRVPLRLGSLRSSVNHKHFKNLPLIFQKLALHSCQYIFVNAESTKQELIQLNCLDSRIIVLQNCVFIVGAPETELIEILKFPQSPREINIVGTVGNLRRNKNIHVFIEGLANVIREYDSLVGVIIGQPIPDDLEYFEVLQQLIADNGLQENIFLLGFREDVPELMHGMDIFCLLSNNEGTPNAILEAMVAAKPVIATRTGGIPDLIKDEENGILVTPGDAREFEAALRKLLSDTRLAGQMGQNGQHRVQEYYNCHNISSQLIRLYQSLLQQ